MKQLPSVRRRRQETAQQSLKHQWPPAPLDAGKIKQAPEQFPTTPRERPVEEQTRPSDFGWVSGNPF